MLPDFQDIEGGGFGLVRLWSQYRSVGDNIIALKYNCQIKMLHGIYIFLNAPFLIHFM